MITEAYLGTEGSTLVKLHDLDSPGNVMLTSIHGLGPPEPRAARVDKPRGHGIYDLTEYYGARVIDLTGIVTASTLTNLSTRVDALNVALAMDGTQKVFKFKRLGSSVYEYCRVVASTVDEPIDSPGNVVEWSAQLIADDPRLYSFELNTSGSFASTYALANAGNFNTPIVIRFYGPGTNPGLQNTDLASEDTIRVNYVMGGGDVVTIDMKERTIKVGSTLRPDILNLTASNFWKCGRGTSHLAKVGGADHIQVDWRDARI